MSESTSGNKPPGASGLVQVGKGLVQALGQLCVCVFADSGQAPAREQLFHVLHLIIAVVGGSHAISHHYKRLPRCHFCPKLQLGKRLVQPLLFLLNLLSDALGQV